MEEYKCESCGEFVREDFGVTALNGEWVCDNDKCRTLDNNNDSTNNLETVWNQLDNAGRAQCSNRQ
ncbi:ArsR family metal-binding transcriptional regulator [Virgibacillus halotolerans]|uniref:hypothetical protein n=1 Tax=Virgibacillus halotolerans TaxID=1071053 RepID=UPI001960002A|nr:hypothetical protein [Virgibacillus halotolerans]MBM7598149.1 ArsR family metal-binding transcriptional regulator [Virgibacillus halotolerans]